MSLVLNSIIKTICDFVQLKVNLGSIPLVLWGIKKDWVSAQHHGWLWLIILVTNAGVMEIGAQCVDPTAPDEKSLAGLGSGI